MTGRYWFVCCCWIPVKRKRNNNKKSATLTDEKKSNSNNKTNSDKNNSIYMVCVFYSFLKRFRHQCISYRLRNLCRCVLCYGFVDLLLYYSFSFGFFCKRPKNVRLTLINGRRSKSRWSFLNVWYKKRERFWNED